VHAALMREATGHFGSLMRSLARVKKVRAIADLVGEYRFPVQLDHAVLQRIYADADVSPSTLLEIKQGIDHS
jgi:hypothetical protein